MAKAPAIPIPTETEESKAVVKWWGEASGIYGLAPESLIHIPNEGKRSFRVAARLKAEGMRPGTPDFFLAVPRGGFHGLWVEMKRRRGGIVSDNQRLMLGIMEAQGYAVQVCYGAEQALDTIQGYLRNV